MNERSKHKRGPRINREIRVPEVRLIADDGAQLGIVRTDEAMRMANERGFDLVEVSPTAKPPVAKIIDYGKYKYEAQKRANESRKKQAVVQLKEIQFRPNIDKHDQEVKLKKITQFLDQGDKVRLIMQFRGREIAYKRIGLEKFNVIIDQVVEVGGQVESGPRSMGAKIFAIIMPTKKKRPKMA